MYVKFVDWEPEVRKGRLCSRDMRWDAGSRLRGDWDLLRKVAMKSTIILSARVPLERDMSVPYESASDHSR
jgi:hypothetical protein